MKLLLLSFIFLCVSKAAAAPTILLTSFEPFFGARSNGSMGVSSALEASLKAAGYNVETCLLPVVYDQAADRARECYSRISPKPSIVISLGEGGCDLRIENLMFNLDSFPLADNAGNIRNNKVIIPGEVKQISITPLATRLYCALSDRTRSSVSLSSYAGGFVCNNTGFRLGLDFRRQRVPFSFIHVPNHRCNSDPNDTAQKITMMIAGAGKKPSEACTSEFAKRLSTNK